MKRDQELRSRLEQAVEMAQAAGQITLQYFQQDNFQVEKKQDRSPVTVADRQAEQYLRQQIATHFANDAIVGEEFGEQEGSSGYRWILDPIDGTKSFIFGVPLYGTLVGIEHEGQAAAGVIHMPALHECVFAARGQGCMYQRHNAAPIAARVSSNQQLADGLFLTSQVDSFAARGADEVYRQLQQRAYVSRTWGDCYGYLLVAIGRADVMIDPIMHVWDAAAIQPILEEAGGSFTDWQGQATIHGGEGVGTNGLLLEEVIAITRRFPKPA